MKTRKVAVLAMCITLALILSYVESQIPIPIPVTGAKIGLANIVVVFALYKLGWKEAAIISLIRVLLVSLLFGLNTIFYSLAGAVLSFAGMLLLKRSGRFSCVAVSVAGGVLHNIGQIGMACLILETRNLIVVYLPLLLLAGTAAGVVIGLLAAVMIRRIEVKL